MGNSTGDIATYTCNTGFELIGNDTTTCVSENAASFTPQAPTCRRKLATYRVVDHCLLQL